VTKDMGRPAVPAGRLLFFRLFSIVGTYLGLACMQRHLQSQTTVEKLLLGIGTAMMPVFVAVFTNVMHKESRLPYLRQPRLH
jgi:hypothetical protein